MILTKEAAINFVKSQGENRYQFYCTDCNHPVMIHGISGTGCAGCKSKEMHDVRIIVKKP